MKKALFVFLFLVLVQISAYTQNLALSKPTDRKSAQFPENESNFANDPIGDNTSFWAADEGVGITEWWKIDLLGIYDLNQIVIRNYVDGTRWYQYNIEVSTDNSNWMQIAVKGNTNVAIDAGDTYNITATARYLRVNITSSSLGSAAHISDFRVYGTSAATKTITASAGIGGAITPLGSVMVKQGTNQLFTITPNTGYKIDDVIVDGISASTAPTYTFNNVSVDHTISVMFTSPLNLALGKTTSSENYNIPWVSTLAVDAEGTNNSYWEGPSPSWWKVDLGAIYDLTSIVVRNWVDGTRYYHYNIEVSTDNSNWTQIAVKSNPNVATDEGDTYNITATARYLRVNMISNSAWPNVHISDFRVYGKTGLTVSGVTATNKIYDGGTTATINTGSLTLSGVFVGDDVSLVSTGATGIFGDKNIGTDKAVSTTGFILAGIDAGKYSLIQPTTTADITTKGVIITPTPGQSKTEGDTDPIFTYTFAPALIAPDVISGALGRALGETVGSYAYTLGDLSAGSNYLLGIVAFPSTFAISTATGMEELLGNSGMTLRNHPNPFVGNTTISYSLPSDGRVTLTIRNLAGHVVKILVSEMKTKGDYSLNIGVSDLQSGVYFGTLSLKRNGKELSRTIRLVKGR